MSMVSHHVSLPDSGRRTICQRVLIRPSAIITMLRAKSTKTHGHEMLLEGADDGMEGWTAAVGSRTMDVCVTTGVGNDVADALAAAV